MLQHGEMVAQRYRVDSRLGSGGMAEVYKVYDKDRATFLALKLLRPEFARPEGLKLFRSEAQALEVLRHPQIVRFYEIGQAGESLFMLMDYVDGETLRDEIARCGGRLPLTRIRDILRPVCSALHYAHTNHVIHCDIKPENILIDRSGSVLLSDFGIARMARAASPDAEDARHTAGTPAYMAPEQIRAEGLTPQTDVYGLGVVLFEMLTGQRPFTGARGPETLKTETERICWEHQNVPPPPPSQHQATLSPGIDAVVLRCLQKDPAARFANVLELYNAFELAQPRETASRVARPAVTAQSQPSPSMQQAAPAKRTALMQERRFSSIWLAAGVVLAVALFGAFWGATHNWFIPPPAGPATLVSTQSQAATESQTKASTVVSASAAPPVPIIRVNACMEFPAPQAVSTVLKECVTAIDVQPDGKMKLTVDWSVSSISDTFGIMVKADTGNHNMYLTDDLGNRLDHIGTGGDTDRDVELFNRQHKVGWFLFPAPAANARAFYFHDDDNKGVTPRIDRRWP